MNLTEETAAALADPKPGMLFGEFQGGPGSAICVMAVIGKWLWVNDLGKNRIVERAEFEDSLRYDNFPGYHSNHIATVSPERLAEAVEKARAAREAG